jgi:segregation and condensation protein A
VSRSAAAAAPQRTGPLARFEPAQVRDYVPGPQSQHGLHQLKLQAFEGPLDLLLFLIRRHSLDIFDIPMGDICQLYASCLEDSAGFAAVSIDVAADFLAMAAELAQIKSKTLLPVEPSDAVDDEELEDPRIELVRRLLEYQKFKEAAGTLSGRPWLGRDVFASPAAPVSLPLASPQLRQASIFALVKAFNTVLQRQQREEPHRVVVEEMSVQKRMQGLVDRLGDQALLSFASLLEALSGRLDLIVCFLAVLELTRMKLVRLMEDEQGCLLLQARFDEVGAARKVVAGEDASYG